MQGSHQFNVEQLGLAVDRRVELLDATTRVIARRGYHETRFQDVADEAGVAVGTLQHHFGTRRRMLKEAAEHWVDGADDQWMLLVGHDGDPWQRLQALLMQIGSRFGERVDSWRMWLDFAVAATKDQELRGSTARSMERWRIGLADAVRAGIEDGSLDPVLPPEEVADVLTALLDGIALQIYAMDSDISGAEIQEHLMVVSQAILRPRL